MDTNGVDTMKDLLKKWLSASLLLLTSCVGTEYIDDPVSSVQIPARVVISPSTTAVQIGLSVRLRATLVNSVGDSVILEQVQWSSSNTVVATVNSEGVVMGSQPGQVRIMAQHANVVSMPALVTVVTDPNQVARVFVSPAVVQQNIGRTQQFTATAYNLNGDALSGRIATWFSSNSSTVSVNANGFASALTAGMAAISAVIDGIESGPSLFTVVDAGASRTGTFVMRPGSGHFVRGTATLSRQTNGNLVLALGSDFASAGGPDVEVYLSATNSIGANSISLGNLQNFSGAQNYNVPSGVQLNTYNWVIIHCVPFNITFGYAQLQ